MASKKRGRISKAFKREVAIEYIQGGGTMQEIALKYNLPNLQTVSNWVRCYLTPEEIQNKRLSLPQETQKDTSMPEKQDTSKDSMISALEQRIQDLEKLLKHSQLKCKALDTLIDIAEEQGIQIRKKSGAKQ
jgi:transposase-like protein